MDKNIRPKLSIVIPIHDMKNGANFLWTSINALIEQTFQDFEIVIVKQGKMAENTNAGIRRAKGELIKIIYLDDYLAHKDSLKLIVEAMDANPEAKWLINGVNEHAYPYWTDDILTGNNKLGSPSALTIRNGLDMYFDENMSWLLDCAFYKEMNDKYGKPIILNGIQVVLEKGDHQMTNILTSEQKKDEENYVKQKYDKFA